MWRMQDDVIPGGSQSNFVAAGDEAGLCRLVPWPSPSTSPHEGWLRNDGPRMTDFLVTDLSLLRATCLFSEVAASSPAVLSSPTVRRPLDMPATLEVVALICICSAVPLAAPTISGLTTIVEMSMRLGLGLQTSSVNGGLIPCFSGATPSCSVSRGVCWHRLVCTSAAPRMTDSEKGRGPLKGWQLPEGALLDPSGVSNSREVSCIDLVEARCW